MIKTFTTHLPTQAYKSLRYSPLTLACWAFFSIAPVVITTASANEAETQTEEKTKTFIHSNDKVERIQITASPFQKTAIKSAQPIQTLSEDILREQQDATLGETLRSVPGVNATFFGPVASRPIIRGLGGPRVKIVQNGLDAADISQGGADHAVTTESLVAEQIEVFRGPATLLFGSGASGGVVNVVDNRLPRERQYETEGKLALGGNTVSNMQQQAFAVDTGQELEQGQAIAFHVDAHHRRSHDYKVPHGFFHNNPFHILDEHESHDDHHEHDHKRIENSYTKDKGVNVGSSFFFQDDSFIGLSYGRLEREYGLLHHDHGEHEDDNPVHGEMDDHHHEHDGIFADFVQDRWQAALSLNQPFIGLKKLEVNLGHTRLTHHEIEDDHIETGIQLRQTELRAIAHHQDLYDWQGALGLQFQQQDFQSVGEEAFTPANKQRLSGIFWLLEHETDLFGYEMGVRVERVQLDAPSIAKLTFTPKSASWGMTYEANHHSIYSLNVSYSERAPQAEEVFVNGAHLGTHSYELGAIYQLDADLLSLQPSETSTSLEQALSLHPEQVQLEKAHNIDLGVHHDGDIFHYDLNLFYNRIHNFFYQHDLQVDANHLNIYQYQQQDVDLYGYELQTMYALSRNWEWQAFSDLAIAKFRSSGSASGYLPRVPAQRMGTSLKYQADSWQAKLSYTYYASQRKVADEESMTPSAGFVDLNLIWYPSQLQAYDTTFYIGLENLTNEIIYVHNSFIKQEAPLPGRNLKASVHVRF